MTGASILPVTVHNGKLLFLFGKENPKENSAKGFSDFGGGVESGESVYGTAMREGGEELTGFLGDSKDIRSLIKRNGGHFEISHNDYHVHMFYIPWDPNLVTYFNLNHRFIWDRMDRNLLNKTKLFEKIEIQWFRVQNLKKRIREFRLFYQDIILEILKQEKEIFKFIRGNQIRSYKRNTKRKSSRKNKTFKI